jgi:hypothetical protein
MREQRNDSTTISVQEITMQTPPVMAHRISRIAILKVALALTLSAAPFCFPAASTAAQKPTAVLTSASGTKIRLTSFSDSYPPPEKVAGQKVAKTGLLTVKYNLGRSGVDPFKSEIAGKRIKSLTISLQNAGKSFGIAYTFSNDVVASVRMTGQGEQSYVTVVFAYSQVSAQGAPAGKMHPDAWNQGL